MPPTRAGRARTALAHAATVAVEIGTDPVETVDVLAVDRDGSLVLLVESQGVLASRTTAGAVPCAVHAALVSGVPGPDRVLDRVTVHGQVELAADIGAALDLVMTAHRNEPAELVLRPDGAALLQVTVRQLLLDGEPVDPAAYARATCDPLAAGSDEFVEHLLREHPTVAVQLAHLLEPEVLWKAQALAPVRVDQFGLTFRVDFGAGSVLARLDFAAALRDPAELPAAMRALQSRAAEVGICPFSGEPPSGAPPL